MNGNKGANQVCKLPVKLFPYRASGAQKTGACQEDEKDHPGNLAADHSQLLSGEEPMEQGGYG